MGEGVTFRERKKTRGSCALCSIMAAASYLKGHMARIHGICVFQTRGVDEVGGRPTTYVVSFPKVIKEVRCTVPGCPVVAHSTGIIREHFMFCHFICKVAVLQEGKICCPTVTCAEYTCQRGSSSVIGRH